MMMMSALGALDVGYWKNVRFSAKLADDAVRFRTELSRPDLSVNKVLYNSGTGITEFNLNLIDPQRSTYQALIPVEQESKYIGLKHATTGSATHVVPVFYPGTGLPELSALTKLSTDASGDQSTNHLDIVSDYVSFSNTKFITAIQNRGGGFPTSGSFGTVYFSYMSVIANPESDPQNPNTIVWALNYMNVSLGGLSPGLYKITGTGSSDLIRIGDIQTQVVSGSNLLIMSCDIADLMADPDFSAWYNPANPVFGMQTIVNRTTVIPFGTTTSDTSPGGIVYPTKLVAQPLSYGSSSISDVELVVQPDEVFFRAVYSNPDNLFPIDTVFNQVDGSDFQMINDTHDYTEGVEFRTANLQGLLAEVDGGQGRVFSGDLGGSFVVSDIYGFCYILGLQHPHNIIVQRVGQNLSIGWSEVTHTELGNPVSVSRYRVEASVSPHFDSFEVLGETESLSLEVPLNPNIDKWFFRVLGIKDVP